MRTAAQLVEKELRKELGLYYNNGKMEEESVLDHLTKRSFAKLTKYAHVS